MPAFKFLTFLKHDPRPRLFGYSSPGPIRSAALQRLENRQETDYLYRHAMRDAANYEPLKNLLEGWSQDGTWGVDRLYMRRFGEVAATDRAMVNMVKNLHLLHHYRWDVDESYPLEEAAQQIYDRAQKDGFLQFISKGAKWVKGKPKTIFRSDHWGGLAAAALVRLGCSSDAIIGHYDYLLAEQRKDGGWLPEFYAGEDSDDVAPSHPLHTMVNAQALALMDDEKYKTALHAALDYLLDHCYLPCGDYPRGDVRRWDLLGFPDFGHSAINLFELVLQTGYRLDHRQIRDIALLLKVQQSESGMWYRTREREIIHDEDMFVTLRIASAIKMYVDDLGIEFEETDKKDS